MIIKVHNQIFYDFDSGLDNWKGLYERWIVYIVCGRMGWIEVNGKESQMAREQSKTQA